MSAVWAFYGCVVFIVLGLLCGCMAAAMEVDNQRAADFCAYSIKVAAIVLTMVGVVIYLVERFQ